MSTRQSIKYQSFSDGKTLHLYEDLMDEENERPVYLALAGVDFEAEYDASNLGQVTVKIPRFMALKLGLVLF